MNRQEILKLVRKHFKPGGVCDDCSCTEYYGDADAFVRFTEWVYEKGKWDGEIKGYYDATGGRAL